MAAMGASSKEHPLLRTLVVCGASLVGLGCGGRTETSGNADGGRSAVTGKGDPAGAGSAAPTTVRCPEQCSSPAQFVCDDLSTGTNCRCDTGAPLTAAACETIWDFGCESAVIGPDCAPFALGPRLSCTCSTERLRPQDCLSTAQFHCAVFEPLAEGCHCDTNAPMRPEDCIGRQEYDCYDYNPEIGCRCEEFTPIR
jgi:hypothetical protein